MLQMKCDRCQGYFRNFTQIVRKGAETYCVQCDAAIKAGAPARMYSEDLPYNSVFECPAETLGNEAAQAGMAITESGGVRYVCPDGTVGASMSKV